MEKFKKIAQIDAINGFEKNRVIKMMKTLENSGFVIVDDPDYPTIFYIAQKEESK